MQINWFTVGAQLINFLVLVWLMKKYLYKPILDAVDQRENKISSELKDAKTKMVEAKKEQDEFKKKNDDFDLNKKKMLEDANTAVANERKKLLDAATVEADTLKQKMEDASKELQKNRADELVQKTQEQVFSIAKKALNQLASTTLEEQTIAVFIDKIKSLTAKEKKQFIDAFHSDDHKISINTAFDLTAKAKQRIKTVVSGLLGDEGKYEFSTSSKKISGIQLSTNGYKLDWSFEAYISDLEKSMASVNSH